MSKHTKETWRLIPGFKYYEVSTHGKVRSWKKARWGRAKQPKLLRQQTTEKGHHTVNLRYPGTMRTRTFLVHRLVGQVFIPGVGRIVRHLDGNPGNNHISNLAWGTYKDNYNDMVAHGNRVISGKLSPKAVRDIRTFKGVLDVEKLADIYNVHTHTIYRVWRGATWSHVSQEGES